MQKANKIVWDQKNPRANALEAMYGTISLNWAMMIGKWLRDATRVELPTVIHKELENYGNNTRNIMSLIQCRNVQ